jgi:hypothetical protein
MLDVGGRVLQQTLALRHVGSQLRNLSFGSKAGSQQSIRMEPLQPLRIADIGLASRSDGMTPGQAYFKPLPLRLAA